MISNRERLLRLIDGGPKAVEKEKKPVVVSPLGRRHWNVVNLARITLAFIFLVLAFRLTSERISSPLAVCSSPGRVADLGAGLRLVGVDWGDPPVALLEDLKTGKTYFARKDDKIKETRVKQIFKDKVLIAIRGKTVELR